MGDYAFTYIIIIIVCPNLPHSLTFHLIHVPQNLIDTCMDLSVSFL